MKHILTFLILIVGLLCTSDFGAEKRTKGFALDYKRARSERQRRDLCIDAIDGGLIRRGSLVSAIDEMFGTTYSTMIPSGPQATEWGTIHFAEQPASRSDTEASGYIGWYLAFEFDHQGIIQNYHLSNVHK